MDDFLSALERRKQTEVAIKNRDIDKLIEKYMKDINFSIDIFANQGKSDTLFTIAEPDLSINKIIANKVCNFLEDKGFEVQLKEIEIRCILQISW